jgi:thiamine-phosphate pyrophosphorylase
MRNDAELSGLYVLTDESLGERMETVTAAAIAGGARIVQYRDKSSDPARREREAKVLRRLTRREGVLFIVNDDPVLAAEVKADGVHVGRDDAALREARGLLGETAIVGVSCYNSLRRARDAVAAGADYVAFGSIYASPTKHSTVRAPLDLFERAKRELDVPVCAIGGITVEKAPTVIAAGADMLAVVSAVMLADAPECAARHFTACFEKKP